MKLTMFGTTGGTGKEIVVRPGRRPPCDRGGQPPGIGDDRAPELAGDRAGTVDRAAVATVLQGRRRITGCSPAWPGGTTEVDEDRFVADLVALTVAVLTGASSTGQAPADMAQTAEMARDAARHEGRHDEVLLGGGSGATGLPLVRQLRAAGHEVMAIHRSAQG